MNIHAHRNRIAEYLYDAGPGTSTLIREYIWMGDRAVGVVEGGQIFYIRTDHIGRPVFATNDLGVKVWEVSYTPFGQVLTITGNAIDLRFPGQWFQAESGLHQNWMCKRPGKVSGFDDGILHRRIALFRSSSINEKYRNATSLERMAADGREHDTDDKAVRPRRHRCAAVEDQCWRVLRTSV